MLGTQPKSSTKAASAQHHWAITPRPLSIVFKRLNLSNQCSCVQWGCLPSCTIHPWIQIPRCETEGKLKAYHAMKSLPLHRQLTPLPQIVGLQKPAVHSLQQGPSPVRLEEVPAAVKLVFMMHLLIRIAAGRRATKSRQQRLISWCKTVKARKYSAVWDTVFREVSYISVVRFDRKKSSRRKSSRWRKC